MILWLYIAAPDISDVPQIDLFFPTTTYKDRFKLLDRGDITGWVDGNEFRPHLYPARIGDHVLLPQFSNESIVRNAQLRHAIAVQFDVHCLDAFTVGINLAHILNQQQFPAQQIDNILDFGIAVTVAMDRNKNTVHITIVIHHDGGAGTRRQLVLDIANLAAQFIPDLLQIFLLVLVFYGDSNRRQPTIGFRLNELKLPHLLGRLFQTVSHLLFYFGGGCTCIGRNDQRLLDGEFRVFQTT